MLQISPWSRAVTLLILFFGLVIALPNALPDSVLQRAPHWLPTNTVSLGLDLQGGASLLLQAELDQAQKDRLNSMAGDIRSNLRKALIAFSHVDINGDSISVRILNPEQFEAAKT